MRLEQLQAPTDDQHVTLVAGMVLASQPFSIDFRKTWDIVSLSQLALKRRVSLN